MQKYNILVVSDSHGNKREVEKAIKSRLSPLDAIIHLGDGCNDLEYCSIPPNCAIYSVRGNCDIIVSNSAKCPIEQLISIGEFNILIMHGHKHSVKSDIIIAAQYAANLSADVLLFGHTHIPTEIYYPKGYKLKDMTLLKPLYVFNPGSIGAYPNTFGNIQIIDDSIMFGMSK